LNISKTKTYLFHESGGNTGTTDIKRKQRHTHTYTHIMCIYINVVVDEKYETYIDT